jgi:5'-nucleotidase
VNGPDLEETYIKGILLTKPGKTKWDDIYEKRQDPYGRDYYWLTGNLVELDENLELDQYAIKNDYVSVSPLHFDTTDYETYKQLLKWDISNLKT